MAAGITVYDGAGCIGGNKVYLDFDDHGLFFDFGLNYKKAGEFYEEFLAPRPARGIHDLLKMGIIPHLNVYRPDLVPGDVDMSSAPRLPVDAVLISHAHMDHVGHAALIDTKVPFVSTPLTLALLKALRDCNSMGIQYDCPYGAVKQPRRDEDRVLESPSKAPYVGRDFMVAGECGSDLRDFWCTCPAAKGMTAGRLNSHRALSFEVECYEVDHSIYGAAAYAVNTPSGWIVYSGDLRLHGAQGDKTREFARRSSGLDPRLLIVEGTRASRESRVEREDLVKDTCLRAAQDAKGLVIADFSPRNFERLDTFKEIARDTDRTLVVLSKDAYLLDAMRRVDHQNRLDEVRIFSDLKTKEQKFEERLIDERGDDFIDPRDIAAEPDRYLVSFSFFDMNRLLDVDPDGGTYIYSSSEAYSEEQEIDFRRLWNWLSMFNIEVKGFTLTVKDGRMVPEFVPGYHASGHIDFPSLLELVREIGPKTVIPVHTEAPESFLELEKDGIEVKIPEEGRRYAL